MSVEGRSRGKRRLRRAGRIRNPGTLQAPVALRATAMDLVTDLRLVLALARLGSLAAAARETGVGTSSVARRLDALEHRLGERLFNRTPKGVFLTQAGEARLVAARQIVDAADEFTRRDAGEATLSGLLRVSCPARFGERCVAPVVAAFLAAHPDVRIELDLTDEVRDLDRDGIDVAVRIGESAPEHNVVRRIAPNRRILVAAPEWIATHSPIASPANLDGVDALMLGSATEWSVRSPDGTVSTVRPRRRFGGRGGDVVLTLCLAGLGVALKSAWEVRELVERGALNEVLPGCVQDVPADIMTLMPSRRYVPRLVRVFVAELERDLRARLDGGVSPISVQG